MHINRTPTLRSLARDIGYANHRSAVGVDCEGEASACTSGHVIVIIITAITVRPWYVTALKLVEPGPGPL